MGIFKDCAKILYLQSQRTYMISLQVLNLIEFLVCFDIFNLHVIPKTVVRLNLVKYFSNT